MPDRLQPQTDPMELFRDWMTEAEVSELNDPNAMSLATTTAHGMPSVRVVLLKGLDPRGFVFYTNKQSRKGEELTVNQHAALLFHWKSLRRQIRIEGPIEDVTEAEADAYFNSRSRASRLGAVASDQSRPLSSRAELEARLAALEARYPGEEVPRPAHWSGYRVLPASIEFWQDMPHRLHDRIVYRCENGRNWQATRLYH